MATIEVLSPQKHQNLCYLPEADASLQSEQNSVLVFANELLNLSLCYPIVIQKNPENGRFCLVALLGLEKGENLFIENNRWRSPHIPLALSRGPFALTFRQSTENNAGSSPLIGVDVDSPALDKNSENNSKGIPLFDGDLPTAFVEETKSKLQAIHKGLTLTERMLDRLLQLQLIEPVNICVQLNDNEKYELQGNYSVNEEKLATLSNEQISELLKQGELKLIHLMNASLNHISTLIYLKQQRLQSA